MLGPLGLYPAPLESHRQGRKLVLYTETPNRYRLRHNLALHR